MSCKAWVISPKVSLANDGVMGTFEKECNTSIPLQQENGLPLKDSIAKCMPYPSK